MIIKLFFLVPLAFASTKGNPVRTPVPPPAPPPARSFPTTVVHMLPRTPPTPFKLEITNSNTRIPSADPKQCQHSYKIRDSISTGTALARQPLEQTSGDYDTELCYGYASFRLLQNWINKSEPEVSLDLFSMLASGTDGSFTHGGSAPQFLENVKKRGFAYRKVDEFSESASLSKSIQSGDPILMKSACTSADIYSHRPFSDIAFKITGELDKIMDAIGNKKAVNLPPYIIHRIRIHAYPSEETSSYYPVFSDSIRERLRRGNLVEVGYCRGSDLSFGHAAVISGMRTVCCNSICKEEIEILDSAGKSGWFEALPVFQVERQRSDAPTRCIPDLTYVDSS